MAHFPDIPDPTDWLATPLSALSPLEAALRCQVCKDLYKTPMLTSCNHTFCSLCIRRALGNDGRCPACRAQEQEMRLRSNWALEEAVAAFESARGGALEFARTAVVGGRAEDQGLGDGDAGDGGDQHEMMEVAPPSPKRRRDGEDDSFTPEGEDADGPATKRLRRSARSSSTRGSQAMAEMARREAVPYLPRRTSRRAEADVYVPKPEPGPKSEPNDGLVACPICQLRMKEALVFPHIDNNCAATPQPTKAFAPPTTIPAFPPRSTAPKKPLDRLPALNYSMLKDGPLRKKLTELGLSTGGSRPILEKRHKEWVTLWNANCDSQAPRSKAELLGDLEVWERTLGSRARMGGGDAMGALIRDKDFEREGWGRRHEGDFRHLIAKARAGRKVTGEEEERKETGMGEDSAAGQQDGMLGQPISPPPLQAEMRQAPNPHAPNAVQLAWQPPSLPPMTMTEQASHPDQPIVPIINLEADVAPPNPHDTASLAPSPKPPHQTVPIPSERPPLEAFQICCGDGEARPVG